MKGFIVLWYGAIADLPFSWHECDGTHGTPDLKNRWVVGAGNSYAVGDRGGFKNYQHDFTSNTHTHDIPPSANPISAGTDFGDTTDPSSVTGTTDYTLTVPPYRCLTYIQKL